MLKKITLISLLAIFFFPIQLQAQNKNSAYYIKKSEKEFKKKNYKEVFKILDNAIIMMPDSALLYAQRGAYNDMFGKVPEAIQDYSAALKLVDDSVTKSYILSNRGATKMSVMDFEGAYIDLKKAVKLNEKDLGALSNLSTACDELGKEEEALAIFDKILEIDPEFVAAYVNLGYQYQKKNEHEKALGYFNKAVELDPKQALIYSNRSYSLLKTGNLKGANKDIDKSIKLYPANSYAYKIKALIQLEEGKKKEACDNLFKANQLGYSEQYGDEVNDLMREHCN